MISASAPSSSARQDDSWMGWERTLLEPFFAADPSPTRLGDDLEALIAARMPEALVPLWRLYLYVRDDGRDRYDLAGVWGAPLPAGTIPTLGDAVECAEAEAHAALSIPASAGEVFLPLEAEEGVVGFVLYRPLPGCPELSASEEELGFLGRLGGMVIARWQRSQLGEASAQRALASTTRYLERLLAMTADAVLLVDPDGVILAVNESAEFLLQQYAIDLVGHPLESALHGAAAVAFAAATQLAARQEVPVVRTLRISNGEGNDNEVEATFERVQVDTDSAAGVLICLKDLKQATNEEWYRRNEARRDRTLALLTQSLLRPVAALRGYLWALKDELGEEARPHELFSALDLQAEWLQSRLETVALLDQFRAQSVLWRDQAVNFATLFDRAMLRVRSRLFARGIRFELPQLTDNQRLWVDVEKWVLALTALLDEVAHHLGGPGSIQVDSRLARGAAPRVFLRVRGRLDADVALPTESDYVAMAASLGLSDGRSPEGMTLARTVIHHYGGTLLWDWAPDGTAAATLTLPLAEVARPEARHSIG